MKHITLKIFLLFAISFLASCGSNTSNTEQSQTGIEYTSAYICPMHCEGSGSETAGQCPVCGMDYVASHVKEVQNNSHQHQ